MRRLLKIVGFSLLGLIALAVLAVALGTGYRAYRQHESTLALRIASPQGIDEEKYVDIGGLKQWLQIRGEDRTNPVLLLVHGGPALSTIPFTYRVMRPWERQLTVVQWDQRGAGRTYFLNGGADQTASGMSQIIDDGLKVAEYLRTRLNKPKIIVMGESWGSAVALEMARARPDLFYAFVGTGQLVDMPRAAVMSYQLLLEQERGAHNDKALRQLTAIGPPPYASPAASATEQQLLAQALEKGESSAMAGDYLSAPGYSLGQSYLLIYGTARHRTRLVQEDERYQAAARGTQFGVPIFFFQGMKDVLAPPGLVREYLGRISAPHKELVPFADGGHNIYYTDSDRFLKELVTRVRPLATADNRAGG